MIDKYYSVYTRLGLRALKCRGYNSSCPVSNKDIRNNAKIPVTKGYQKDDYKGLSLEECEDWISNRGWIGWTLPKGMFVLDVDKDTYHIEQIDSYIKENSMRVPVHNTKNGKHYFFTTQEDISANSSALIKLGFEVTYRIGGKSQLILCPMEPERTWENLTDFSSMESISDLPDILKPLNLKNKMGILEAITTQLSFYYQKGVLSGVDLDFSFSGFLIDELSLTIDEFKSCFEKLFLDDYNEDQTEVMFHRGSDKDVKQSTGTLIQILQEKNLNHIIFLISNIEKITKKNKSPQQQKFEKNAVVDFFNKEHAIVDMGGKIVVLKENFNSNFKKKELTFYDFPNFRKKYQSLPPVFWNKKPIPQTEIWISAENRREYNSIDYLPGDETEHLKIYNVWSGFSVRRKEGNCSKYLEHIRNVIASGDEKIYNYLLDWMADSVQNLKKRSGVAIIMKGRQGVGKGVFASNFGKVFGDHFLHIGRANALTGNFNSELMGKSLVFADEAFWGGDKAIAGILKSMITEDTLRIEYKGKEPFYTKNYIRIIAASNNDRVVPAEMSERRFFVLEVSDKKIKDYSYFTEIENEMSNGGRAHLLDILLKRDLSIVDIRDFPKTKALMSQKIYNLDSTDSFFYEFLETASVDSFFMSMTNISQRDCDFYYDNIPKGSEWITEIPSSVFFKFYLWWAKERKEKHPCNSVQSFSMQVQKTLSVKASKIKNKKGEWVRGYIFPSVDKTRKNFESHLGQEIFLKEENNEELDLDE